MQDGLNVLNISKIQFCQFYTLILRMGKLTKASMSAQCTAEFWSKLLVVDTVTAGIRRRSNRTRP